MAAPVPNSSTGGFLVPAAPAPLDDAALEDLFHDTIAGVLNFQGPLLGLVRPRFQSEPPNDPPQNTNWVAFGLTMGKRDWDRYERHDPTYYGEDGGATISEQDQEFELHLSFYGPDAGALQGLFEDSIKIAQNRDALDAKGIKFMSALDAYRLPALLKQRWANRWDQKFKFRRRVTRVYPILNLASASVHSLNNEQYLTDITVTPPSP